MLTKIEIYFYGAACVGTLLSSLAAIVLFFSKNPVYFVQSSPKTTLVYLRMPVNE